MKKLFTTTLWLLLAFPVGNALAQTGTITGTVTDSTTGGPLPGVNVVVQGLNIGSATNAQGVYTIESVPVGEQTLLASFIGYGTKTIPLNVTEGTNQVDIVLASQAIGLENVVVTALGVEREERSLGYSVQAVEGEELARVPETNFVKSLQGKVAGANFFSSNAMGGSSRIVLRGVNSVSGNNQPLIVVDGIPMNNANFTTQAQEAGGGGYDYGNAASIINPSNVQSVTVLKGPSAAALYGSRGANGVIQITTKSGAGTQGIGVTVNTSVMASQVYGYPDYQNEFGGGGWAPFSTIEGSDFLLNGEDDQMVVDYATDQSWGPRLDGRMARQWYSWDDVNGLMGQATPWVAHPNNIQNYYQTGVEFNTTVSFSQAAENFNYRLSLANIDETGVYPNARLGRKQFGFNGSVNLTEDFEASIVANYIDSDARARPGTGYDNENVFLQFTHFGQRQVDLGPDSYMRDYRRIDSDQRGWNWNGVSGAQSGTFIYTDNPYWVQYENFESDDTERLFGKIRLEYALADVLTLSGEAGTDFYTEQRRQRVAVNSQAQASYLQRLYEVQESSGSVRLTYDGQLSDEFSLRTFAATGYRYQSLGENTGQTQGGLSVADVYTLENSVSRPTLTDDFESKGVYSLYGAANLGWRELLYLDLTARNDWSSTLPGDNNSYFYPSVAASFVFSSLPVLQGADVLSFGKLRLSWARVGNDTDPYRLLRTFPINTPFGDKPALSMPRELNNANLKPEITSGWEVGTQLQFFNNRLGLDATYYYESTRNQILAVDVSRTSGFGQILLNAGEITNQGFELALTTTPVLTENFEWNVAVNWAKNVGEVVELAEGLEAFTVTSGVPFGPDVQARVEHPYGVFFGTGFVYDANGNLVLQSNGWPESSAPKVIGSYQPDWTAGVSSTLSYKGLFASVTLNGQRGGEIWSLSNVWGISSGMFQESVEGHVRQLGVIPEGVWFPDGMPDDPSNAEGEEFTARIDPNGYFTGFYAGPDEMALYDASYIKLREVTLGYTLPQQWFAGTPIQRLTVSAIGRNLATLFKNTPNIDPSYALSSGNVQGVEAGQIPPVRSYGLSFRLTL